MRLLTLEDVVGREQYAGVRADYRAAVIAHKRERRLPVGDHVTLVFEDRETLRFQVQEMLWVEGITEPDKAQYELDTYNELIPGPGEISATLFIEITDSEHIRAELDRLIGVDEHVSLVLGEGTGAESLPARFDPKQLEEDRISAVQYIKFQLDPRQQERLFERETPASLEIDHPNYPRVVPIPATLRQHLIDGLRGDPDRLLPEPSDPMTHSERIVLEREHVRVVVPHRVQARGHVVVEPIGAGTGILTADPALFSELFETLREAAAECVRQHGSCRVVCDVEGPETPLRWHLVPTPR